MKILLEIDVDEAVGRDYERLELENKVQFKQAVYQMLQKTTANLRSKKLRKLLNEIRKESASGCTEFDPEILYAILRTEEY